MIVESGSIQNAKLIKEHLTNLATEGKVWLAVGSGNDSWDTTSPSPNKNINKLVNEVFRVQVEPADIELVTVNENPDQDMVDENGSVLRILGNVVCPLKPLREYGLFIGDSASEIVNSGSLYLYDTQSKVVLGQLQLYMKYVYINF